VAQIGYETANKNLNEAAKLYKICFAIGKRGGGAHKFIKGNKTWVED
jgi:hypothetical protein